MLETLQYIWDLAVRSVQGAVMPSPRPSTLSGCCPVMRLSGSAQAALTSAGYLWGCIVDSAPPVLWSPGLFCVKVAICANRLCCLCDHPPTGLLFNMLKEVTPKSHSDTCWKIRRWTWYQMHTKIKGFTPLQWERRRHLSSNRSKQRRKAWPVLSAGQY